MRRPRANEVWIFAATWLAAFVLALCLDRVVAQWVHDAVPVNKHERVTGWILAILKLPGHFYFTLCVAALLAIFHRHHLGGALALILSAIGVGALYSVIKWIVGRRRPVIRVAPWDLHPFPRGLRGIWGEPALSFPSGHASLAFATAACLAVLLPRYRWAFFALAAITAAERVAENAHYLSDVVAGAGMGMIVGWGLTRVLLPERA